MHAPAGSTPDEPNDPVKALRRQRDRFVALAFAAADLLLEVDDAGVVTFAAGASQRLYGRDTDRLIGTRLDELLAEDDRPIAAALLHSIERGGRFVPVTLRLARPDAQAVTFGGCRLPDRPGTSFIALSASAPAAGGGAAAAPSAAMLDGDDFAAAATQRLLESGSNTPYQLTLVAVDELEELQSRLTDEVGQGLAATIERYLLSSAPGVELAGRLAGERFGVLHRDALDETRLRDGIETIAGSIDPEGKGVRLRTSTMPLDRSGMNGGDAARALIYCLNQFADTEAEAFSVASLRDGLDRALSGTVARVSHLRSTVADGAFDLVFQPIVDLKTRTVHHVEALSRFAADNSPAGTVAFAEAVRLIADFDLAVCERVIAAMTAAASAGTAALPVAVNLSGRSLESRLFRGRLTELLDGQDAALSGRLLFEVTESAVITRAEEVNAAIQALRSRGFRVCLDDFGAGANSFHYLRSFVVDFIKIDGAFGRAALGDPRDRSLLQAILAFCRETGVATIGEMVEEEAQAHRLERLGVDYAQGYLFGKPSADLAQWAPPPAGKRTWKRRGAIESWR
jgi:EAL domain-containing protein (putative c-di-GMP-specific phosphodiesterase class I)